nr:uncharacterized protein LOC109154289 [Ipomoea batatas]
MINVAISLRFAGSYGRPRMIESGTGQFHHVEALSKVLSFILQIGQTSWVLISSSTDSKKCNDQKMGESLLKHSQAKGSSIPREAEAMAIREALSWLKRHNYNFVQVETDALQIIQSLNQIGDASSFDLVLFDVKDLLCSLMHVAISHDCKELLVKLKEAKPNSEKESKKLLVEAWNLHSGCAHLRLGPDSTGNGNLWSAQRGAVH